MTVRRPAKRPAPLTASHIVALNLRRARELRGLSQAEAGELLGRYLQRPWSAATVSAAERSFEKGPERSFTANELDGFSRAFGLPVLWFLLPPGPEETSRPLPERWVSRLLWKDAEVLRGRLGGLARDRALLGRLGVAEDAVAQALVAERGSRVRGLAAQLREVATTLERASRQRSRTGRGSKP